MPWPMVHLAISNILYAGNPTPSLLIGSISPDAIHMRGQVTKMEKGQTHLVQNGKLPSKALIMEALNKYLTQSLESEWKDFIIGYFTHIYTDMRWSDTIYTEFEQNYEGDNIRGIYNQEMSQVEFELKRSIKNATELIRLLKLAEGHAIHPFVTKSEVSGYRDIKVEWIENTQNEPRIKPVYFESIKVHQFIVNTSLELEELLHSRNVIV